MPWLDPSRKSLARVVAIRLAREETCSVKLSTATAIPAFRKLGLPLREVLFAVERDEEEQAAWCYRPRVLDLKYLVFGGECILGTHP